MISIFGPPSRRVRVTKEIGKQKRNSAVRNETQREIVGSWKLWTWTDFATFGPVLKKEVFMLCAVPYSFTHPIFPTLENYIHYPMYFQFLIVSINVYRHFHLEDAIWRGDRQFSPRNDAQQATRLPHCSVERDHDALNEGCTCAVCTCV